MTTTILCPTPTDQTQVLQLINPKLTPINRPDMVIIQDGDRVGFTHLSDCGGYQYTAAQWIEQHLIGKQFKHKNGNIYTPIILTNTDATPERVADHPIDIVYIGQNGKVWSRRLSDWHRSFTKTNLTP